MREGTRNTLVGLFIVSGTCILLSLALFLRPALGDGKRILRVRFHEIDRLVIGTRVCFAGKSVGRIVNVQYIPECRRKSIDKVGRVFPFEVTLSVDSVTKILKSDEIFAHNIGLLGERVIFIRPIKADHTSEEITPQDILWAQVSVEFEDLINTANSSIENINKQSQHLERVLIETYRFLKLTEQKLGDLNLKKFDLEQVFKDFSSSITTALKENPLFDSAKESVNQFSNLIQSLQQSLNYIAGVEGFENTLLKEIVESVQSLLAKISSDKGTLGKLLQSEFLYLKIVDLIEEATQLVEAVKKYGVFFQNNREWRKALQEQEREKLLKKSALEEKLGIEIPAIAE